MHRSTAHEFACYYDSLSKKIVAHSEFAINDELLFHRVIRVLRLSVNETCILFDSINHARVELLKIDRNSFAMRVIDRNYNQPLSPIIKCYLPILKREAFEEALYDLTEMGANEIQLITAAKTHRSWAGDKELERSRKIIVAACEQAKQFTIPRLAAPISIAQALSTATGLLIRCDPEGNSLESLLPELKKQSTISIISGPEGGFTHEEIDLIKNARSLRIALTPTILRAQKAIALATGAVRCLSSADRVE